MLWCLNHVANRRDKTVRRGAQVKALTASPALALALALARTLTWTLALALTLTLSPAGEGAGHLLALPIHPCVDATSNPNPP